MKRTELLNKLIKVGVVSVVRANSTDKAIKIVDAVISGGVKGIELTYTVPHADEVIAEMVSKYEGTNVVIGAGTVLDEVSARLAIIAGAEFIVSPTFNVDVAQMCNLYQVPYIPGVLTPAEAQEAIKYGSDIVKLFPGSLATPAAIKELKGPFPYINIMPSGGVTADNLQDWFEAGAVVVGAGGGIVGPAEHDDYDGVANNANKYMQAFSQIVLA